MSVSSLFDPALLNKYNISGPRYTSYPTALEFREIEDKSILSTAAANSDATGLSLYIHIPFCHSLCYYCGCNKIVTRHKDKADRYLDYLEKEAESQSTAFQKKTVEQLHLGGGTPSFLTSSQQTRLMAFLRRCFTFSDDAEISIEIDPRQVTTDYIKHLASLGYNRLSIGVQDTDYRVQEAINRVQSTSHIADIADYARTVGFTSVNLDLIYGLPHQTPDTFITTLAAAKAIAPERISLFSYAHLPSRFAAQRKIKDAWLPNPEQKTALMKLAMERLTARSYVLIGMDHFAKPNDELAIAQTSGRLHRNFQGYTTRGDLDLLGLGVSSISAVGNAYTQNPKTLNDYYGAIDAGSGTLEKGVVLSRCDELRRYIIQQLMCNLQLNFSDVEHKFGIDFKTHFTTELQNLQEFEKDKLLAIDNEGIRVFERARLFIRIICMTFDAYLNQSAHQHRYSRVI